MPVNSNDYAGTTNAEFEKLADQPKAVCPNCGYCPHCGRGGHGVAPYQPMPYPYYDPWGGHRIWM